MLKLLRTTACEEETQKIVVAPATMFGVRQRRKEHVRPGFLGP